MEQSQDMSKIDRDKKNYNQGDILEQKTTA